MDGETKFEALMRHMETAVKEMAAVTRTAVDIGGKQDAFDGIMKVYPIFDREALELLLDVADNRRAPDDAAVIGAMQRCVQNARQRNH
jgi:hypothetical protein